MKSWPAAFATELQKTTGITPCLIWRLVVDGTTYDISDSVITFPPGALNGFTSTKAWVRDWGSLRENVSGNIGEILVADYTLSLLADQADASNIRHLALQHELEANLCQLYIWLPSLDASVTPPQLLCSGYVQDISIPDETAVNITVEDETTRLREYLGTQITSEAYPFCDPDEVGRMIPIVFGTVSKLPARCIDSGWVTALNQDITIADTSFKVSELPVGYSAVNRTIIIDDEKMLVTAVTVATKTITVVRAQGGTITAGHSNRSTVMEVKSTPLIYLCADHPLTAIGTIYARIRGIDIDITADCTKYLGTVGNQLAAYPGKAAITIPDFAKVSQRVLMEINDQLKILDGFHTHTTGSTVNNTPYTDGIAQALPISGSIASQSAYNVVTNPQARLFSVCTALFNETATINSSVITISCTCSQSLWQLYVSDKPNIWDAGAKVAKIYDNLISKVPFSRQSSLVSHRITITSATDMQYRYLHLAYDYKDAANMPFGYNYPITGSITVLSRSITSTTGGVATTGAASLVGRSGGITLSGNSIADIMLGDQLLVDVTNSHATPAAAMGWLLSTYCNDSTLTQTGTLPDFYALNGAITEYKRKIEWLDRLAFELRCWYRKIAGVSRLIVRRSSPSSPTVISACALNSEGLRAVGYKKAPKTDVINVVKTLYKRDWTAGSRNAEAYQAAKTNTDDASIATYGRIEQPDMFMFDFITTDGMASDVGVFYRDFYGLRKWHVAFRTFLNHATLEFADDVQLAFANDLTGVIIEAGFDLASGDQMPGISFTVATTKIPADIDNGVTTLLGDQLYFKDGTAITYLPP